MKQFGLNRSERFGLKNEGLRSLGNARKQFGVVQFVNWNRSQICDLISRHVCAPTIFIKPETIFLGTKPEQFVFRCF